MTTTGKAVAGTLPGVNIDGTINPVMDSGVTITGAPIVPALNAVNSVGESNAPSLSGATITGLFTVAIGFGIGLHAALVTTVFGM